MSSTHTIFPGYSGPIEIDFDAVEDVAVDVFGRDEVPIVEASPLLPVVAQAPKALEFELLPGQLTSLGVFAEGRVRWTYLSGAYQPAGGAWNDAFLGPYAGADPLKAPTYRPWLLVEGDQPLAFFPNGFPLGGALDAATAEAAARGTHFDFHHPGGQLWAIWDNDPVHGNTPAGAVTFKMQEVPYPSGVGFWDVVWSSLPDRSQWPSMSDQLSPTPTIRNVSPGLHLVRVTNIDIDGQVRWQNYYVWAWRTPPREGQLTSDFLRYNTLERDKFRQDRFSTIKAQVPAPWELFPVRPPKQLGGVFPQDTYIRQPPPTTGNHAERPDRVADLPKERGRKGAAEDY